MNLAEPPHLVPPTIAVRDSWLAAERAECEQSGSSTELLDRATADFGQVVAERQGVVIWWDVPTTFLWYVSGEHYLGDLVIRHELTQELLESGGSIGFSISPMWRRQGHATRMLSLGLIECRRLGLHQLLLTCGIDNEASRRVIIANGGSLEGHSKGEDKFWITLDDPDGDRRFSPGAIGHRRHRG